MFCLFGTIVSAWIICAHNVQTGYDFCVSFNSFPGRPSISVTFKLEMGTPIYSSPCVSGHLP